jgi:hypothetical protein
MPPRLYLDNAATSFPKPPAVIEAMVRYANEVGGSAGRGVLVLTSRDKNDFLRHNGERFGPELLRQHFSDIRTSPSQMQRQQPAGNI